MNSVMSCAFYQPRPRLVLPQELLGVERRRRWSHRTRARAQAPCHRPVGTRGVR